MTDYTHTRILRSYLPRLQALAKYFHRSSARQIEVFIEEAEAKIAKREATALAKKGGES